MEKSSEFKLGNRYTHYDRNLCYEQSLKAIKQGYQVRYGISYMGQYFYEIIDPFEKDDNND